MNQSEGNLEHDRLVNFERHVVERQFANQEQRLWRELEIEKKYSRRAAAEENRTAGRKRERVLRKIHHRGSQDTFYGPDVVEHAGLETQGVLESKIHHRGSQDTFDGPDVDEHVGLGTLYAASATAGVHLCSGRCRLHCALTPACNCGVREWNLDARGRLD